MPLSPRRVLLSFRYAMFFDGVDDYVLVPHSASVSITGKYTFMAWINPLTFGGLSRGRILDKNPTVASGYIFYIENTPGTPVVYALLVFINNTYAYVSNVISLGVFQSVGAVFTGSTMRFYVNGRLVGSPSFTVYPSANTENLYIGNRRQLDRGFYGYIHQILIYKDRDLPDRDITWNHLNPDNPVRDGLVLWLKAHPGYVKDIDGDGLLEWIDLSGNGNHGKIYGARLIELIRTPARALPVSRTLPVAR
jgi:hypothetical protein